MPEARPEAPVCRGCGQAIPGSRDVMVVGGRPEHISCYDAEWDEPTTFAPIDDVLEGLSSIPGIDDNLAERQENARRYAEQGPGRPRTEAEMAQLRQEGRELIATVSALEMAEHERCIEDWKRRFANGAVAVTKHPLAVHHHCRYELGYHVEPHQRCILR